MEISDFPLVNSMQNLSRKTKQFLTKLNPFLPFTQQRSPYVNVKMKWKKDTFYDPIDILTKSKDLKTLITLKNIIVSQPSASIPISLVSKHSRRLEVSGRVVSFLRRYPAIFEEFVGPRHALPWFRLTPQASELHREEESVYEAKKFEIVDRLRRLILMSREKRLPLRVVQGMLWFLGLPEDLLRSVVDVENCGFRVVDVGDDEKGLGLARCPDELPLSVLQRNAMVEVNGGLDLPPPRVVAFPLFPSKGVRLKEKIKVWLEEFQGLEYVSPYDDFSSLDPGSDVSEKRVAGVLHELLSLFVDNFAERRKLLCLKKYLGLPQKFHKVFERHPHVFYLLLKEKTCFVVLKEAFCAGSSTAIEEHPLLEVRKKYMNLMHESQAIIRRRRNNGRSFGKLSDENQDVCVQENCQSTPDNSTKITSVS